MNNQSQTIPCPEQECRTPIPFNTYQLLLGVQFACPSCGSLIGLAVESKELVQETMQKFEDIKGKIAQ